MLVDRPKATLHLRRAPGRRAARGLLRHGQRVFACTIGESGITTRKREGDRATPAGAMALLGGCFRRDRLSRPRTPLPLVATSRHDGWCDDPAAATYNRPIGLPVSASHETLWRADRLYDICIVLDWNIRPRRRFGGSAIFLHFTGEDAGPTLGCVALEPAVLRRLLPRLPRRTVIRIEP